MPEPPVEYKRLLDSTKKETAVGDSINDANMVYYETRSGLRCWNKHSQSSGKFFQGKLNGIVAECVAISPKDSPCRALSARTIAFICFEMPDEPKVFQRTGTHRGQWGLLKDRVTCRIIVRFENIPDTR